jgi:bifunctional UDP-N-acetylglucosamine pyrophosphorylase / glucosamine-1-phosphate N-acetyltransferase
MAAGLGTRMKSSRPKHLHPLLGRRLLDWVVEAVAPLAPSQVVVVVSPESEAELVASLPEGVEVAVQLEPRGTGDAVAAARERLGDFEGDVLVVAGDAPLLTSDVLQNLLAVHRQEDASVTVLSIEPEEARPYGRILRDERGELSAIVEEGDATPEELAVRELNASTYVFSAPELWNVLGRLDPSNAQGELYLTDAIRHLVADGRRAAVYPAPDPRAGDGVNTRDDLAQAAAVLRERVVREHMLAGVTVVDPTTTWIEADVEIEPDAVIHPFTILRGRTIVRAHAEVGPHAVVVDSEIGPGAVVGPFAYLRPGAVLAAEAKVGAFVEVKNSTLGERVKVPHLSYIGDAEIGEGTNIGAGAITANYRPEQYDEKQRTVIGRDVHTGSDNVFVAPVEIGDHAWIAAGSTITEDVPPGALAVARAKQVNKENYVGGNRDD